MNMRIRIWLMIFITVICSDANEAAVNIELSSSDFVNISNSDLFVDKSLFIRAIFAEKILLITAPRKFGKSTNMNMLKMFLEIEVDKNGLPIQNLKGKETKNCKFFKDREFNIYKDSESFFYDNCGEHPVLYVDFKHFPANNYASFMNSFRTLLNNVFQRYSYLVKETNGKWAWSNEEMLPQFNVEQFMTYYEKVEILKLNESEISNGLKYLSRVLKEYFGKKVFVLIDEYDAPIFKTLYENSSSETERIFEFIGLMISDLFKSNECVERGLINSRVQCAHVLSPQAANNVITYVFLGNHSLSEFYGFTSAEMDKLVPNKDKRDDAKEWYKGYTVFGKENIEMYNPWSIANYLASGRLDQYWASRSVGTDYLKILLSHPDIRKQVDVMLDGGYICIHTPIMYVEHIKRLKFVIQNPGNNQIGIKYSNLFFQFFCDCGYFNVVEKGAFYTTIRIPNLEIRQFFYEYP